MENERCGMVRLALYKDIPAIEQIAKENADQLGFLMRVIIKEKIKKNNLYVYDDGVIKGFVLFNITKKGYITVNDLCTAKEYRGQGIACKLMERVNRAVIILKVTEENPANEFYKKIGGQLIRTEPGKKRKVNVYIFKKGTIKC